MYRIKENKERMIERKKLQGEGRQRDKRRKENERKKERERKIENELEGKKIIKETYR